MADQLTSIFLYAQALQNAAARSFDNDLSDKS